MTVMALIDEERIQTLAASFSGALVRPEDAGYEEARRIHNGLIDRRPALIARCLNTADVVDAVNLGREELPPPPRIASFGGWVGDAIQLLTVAPSGENPTPDGTLELADQLAALAGSQADESGGAA